MNAWAVCCESCKHRWNLVGNFSEYERQAIESRPCPKCGAYTLSSPEPTKPQWKRAKAERPAAVRMAG